MRTLYAFIVVGSACLATTSYAFAETGTLRISGAGERIDQLGGPRGQEELVNTNRDRVQYSWVQNSDVELQRNSFKASSRGFRLTVSGDDLIRGVTVVTDAPGAAVLISPAKESAALAYDTLQITGSDGTQYGGNEALRRVVDGAALRAYGVPFESTSLAFELAPVVGAGRMQLKTRQALAGDNQYVVQVVDRNSTLALGLSASRSVFLENGLLKAQGALARVGAPVPMLVTQAYLSSPTGERIPVLFASAGDGAALVHQLPAAGAVGQGLWDLHLDVRAAGTGVMRTVKTSFAIARPTARFAGSFRSYDSPAADIVIAFGVEVSTGGRYEVRALLLGSDETGAQRPAMMASGAAWLQPGTSSLELRFDRAKLVTTGLAPPYTLVDLKLLDQSRLVGLHSLANPLPVTLGKPAD